MKTYVINKKDFVSIHSIHSHNYDREIKFPKGCEYAVVVAPYYGGRGYTAHRTAAAAIKQSVSSNYSNKIIDTAGVCYLVDSRGRLVRDDE